MLFGTGIEVDAYLVAYTIPFSAFIVLRDVIGPAFLPTFLRTRRQSEADGWRLFGTVGTVLVLLLGAATVAGMLAAEPLISLTAPGFAGEQRRWPYDLTRLVMPALLLLGLSTLTTAVLHADKRFTRPALGQAVFRVGPLVLFGLCDLGFWLLAGGAGPGGGRDSGGTGETAPGGVGLGSRPATRSAQAGPGL